MPYQPVSDMTALAVALAQVALRDSEFCERNGRCEESLGKTLHFLTWIYR